jgi:hypothetical protein
MIAMPLSVFTPIPAVASSRLSIPSRKRSKLAALCAVLTLLLCGAWSIASAQTAHFSG